MDYEDISTIVVLAVLVVFIIGWLPTRTADSMKRVIRRRQDRFSPSLHLIDEHSGTRFSDEHPPVTKGAAMPAQAQVRVSHEHIAEVRRLRRASIRHRRIVVAVLALAAVIVAVAAYLLHFPMAYALIPFALMLLTLALGVRASRHARQWEHKVSQALRQERQTHAVMARKQAAVPGKPATADAASSQAGAPAGADTVETGIMEQREIHQAVEQTLAERDRALARKAAQAQQRQQTQAVQDAQSVDAQVVDVQEARHEYEAVESPEASRESQTTAHDDHRAPNTPAADMQSDQPAESAPAAPAEPKDVTVELSRVSPATTLDVFDMAAEHHQDLISFSWGAPRNHADEPATTAAPESLEIKSTKQVAKAVPVDAKDVDAGETAKKSGNGGQSTGHAQAHDAPMNNADTFHRAEEHARVDVPEATSDSLGQNLRAALKRRVS